MAGDDDLLNDAIRGTEKELFASAFGTEDAVLDETGDTSAEQMGEGLEGQHEPDTDAAKTAKASEEGDEVDDAEEDDGEGDTKRDDKGRFAKDAKDDAAKADKPKADDKDEPEAKADEAEAERRPEPRVPPGRLREERQKREAVEAERDALRTKAEAGQREFADLNAKLELALRQIDDIRRAPKPDAKVQQEPKPRPDLFEDPEGFVNSLNQSFEQKLAERDAKLEQFKIETSLQTASARHGDTFAKAYEAVTKLDPRNPNDLQTGQALMRAPNPGEAIVDWYRHQETLRRVGPDPDAYEKRIADDAVSKALKDPEVRKQLLASLREEAETGDNGRPRTTVRLPRSVNGASGGSSPHLADPSASDGSERSVFNSALS